MLITHNILGDPLSEGSSDGSESDDMPGKPVLMKEYWEPKGDGNQERAYSRQGFPSFMKLQEQY